jgi:hypothetical protein
VSKLEVVSFDVNLEVILVVYYFVLHYSSLSSYAPIHNCLFNGGLGGYCPVHPGNNFLFTNKWNVILYSLVGVNVLLEDFVLVLFCSIDWNRFV